MANISLQKKSAARIAAVQCLYLQAMVGEAQSPQEQVAMLKKQLSGDRDEQKLLVGQPIEPDYTMLERLLSGVALHRDDMDAQIDASLSKGWTRARMSPLLLGILQSAIFELMYDKGLKPAVVTDEYTRLTRNFFGEEEAGFVHGVLRKFSPNG